MLRVPVLLLAAFLCRLEPPSVTNLLEDAEAALKDGKTDEALKSANDAVKADPKSADAYLVRGIVLEAMRKHKQAIADLDRTIAVNPRLARAYNHRGSEYLKLGDYSQSIKDFDKFLELEPTEEPSHWKRGIAYFYAGRYEEGRKQFEACNKADKNNAEHALWRFLCVARVSGAEKARLAIKEMNPIDRRHPMNVIHGAYCGGCNAADVVRVARQGPAQGLTERLFCAHFYMGLLYDAAGAKKVALEYINKAADDYKIDHDMWDIALLHRNRLRGELEH
jgi:lipoprotein NlpI